MKLSQAPTNWLVIKAHTHSENYSVDFVLVNLTDAEKQRLTEMQSYLKQAPGQFMPYTLTYWDTPEGWYSIDYEREEEEELEEMLYTKDKQYFFLDATDEEIGELTKVDLQIENSLINFNRDGDFWFDGNLKYSDVQFYTSHIKLKEIL